MEETKEQEGVELIASGYEWVCPICETFNQVIEVSEVVKCKKCQLEFTVKDYYHAIR